MFPKSKGFSGPAHHSLKYTGPLFLAATLARLIFPKSFCPFLIILLQRYLFMKLAYTQETPDDYEPPFFQAEGERQPAYFARQPFSMYTLLASCECWL